MSDATLTRSSSHTKSMLWKHKKRGCWLWSRRAPDLWSLIGHIGTLSAGDRIIHILTEVVSLHSDQVTGWSSLTWRKMQIYVYAKQSLVFLNPCSQNQTKVVINSVYFMRLILFTIVKVPAKFVIGASFDHLCHVLCLFVDRHGSDDAAMWRRGHQLDLNRTGFGNLTVELLQQGGVLE